MISDAFTRMKKNKQHPVMEDKPNRATTGHGSTTQGGSNIGQGSLQLSNDCIEQGSESNDGSSYNGEAKWNNEALRKSDLPQPTKNTSKK